MKNSFVYKVLLVAMFVFMTIAASAQSIEVHGKVTDEKGEPMPGVGIIDKNNPKNGAVTDIDGLYRMKIAKDGFLEFSFISYETAIVPVDAKTLINISMKPSAEQLEKVVVIGYNFKRKRY